jgi:chromosomal replication initiation ATPase DnaA
MESLTSVSPLTGTVHRAGRGASPWDREELTALVGARLAVPLSELVSATRRCAAAAFARQIAMYLAHVSFGANYSEIGRAFGRDRTTAAHACRTVEERRDDPDIDATLEQLERDCAALRAAGAIGGER